MAGLLAGEPSLHGTPEGVHKVFHERTEEGSGRWYFSRKEIEENSPSRQDGIDLKKETYLRKSYCTFLQDLGMRLKVPQVTIATAIIFCHRFFLRQSHVKNERRTIATVCMFLAGKVEETPRPLKDVILVSYEIIHKKDPAAVQRIKQKEVYEQQKELILLGERVVLGTLGFDLNVNHPYKPLVEAIKKFKVAQNALAQVAWNFVNDGLRTSLCLQFKPHHIAAGAIFLAAKFLKVKLPHDGEKVWWQEFDVTPRQLEEVSNQMLELYEQNKAPQSQAGEAEGSAGASERPPPSKNDDHVPSQSSSHGGSTAKHSSLPGHFRTAPDQAHASSYNGPLKSAQARHDSEINSTTTPAGMEENEVNDQREDEQGRAERRDASSNSNNNPVEMKDNKFQGKTSSPQDANKKLDREKLKAAFERRKARGDITRKADPVDELERELEDVEVPTDKRERKSNWSKPPVNRSAELDGDDFDAVEEGEVEPFDDKREHQSPKLSARKRKPGSPLDKPLAHKQAHYPEDRNGLGRYSERDHKRHLQENHV
ncbi:Cyclin-T1-5 [Striga hermonthica]|uniref:Cyclin-T1-5 n=1 Tax=Striga hermonthica TaxID=68872 RepID=A0A9N7MVK7_STRHE|nr:Cyclin-T1-5 [Striga hermonthica]